MKPRAHIYKFILLGASALLYVVSFQDFLLASPAWSLFQNPLILHDIKGPNPYRNPYDRSGAQFDILPYWQHASGAQTFCKDKVPAGDRLGLWSMLGLMYGTLAAPGVGCDGLFPEDCYPLLADAQQRLIAVQIEEEYDQINPIIVIPTDDSYTYPESPDFGAYSYPLDYDQYGLRGKFHVGIGSGFGITVRGGFGCYRQCGTLEDQTPNVTHDPCNVIGSDSQTPSTAFCDSNGNPCTSQCYSNPSMMNCDTQGNPCTDPCPDDTCPRPEVTITEDFLMAENKRKCIEREINLDLSAVQRTEFEDVHVELEWFDSFIFEDSCGCNVVKFRPRIAGGIFFPTGQARSQDRALELDTGNYGAYAGTLDASLNFDFTDCVEIGFGGAVTISGSKTDDFRLPTSKMQSNIYPWKVRAKRNIGAAWWLHGGFKSYQFIDCVNFYGSYIFIKKEEDTFNLLDDCPCRNSLFLVEKAEKETGFHAQYFHVGVEWHLADNAYLGFAVSAPVRVNQAYRTTNVFGTIRFVF